MYIVVFVVLQPDMSVNPFISETFFGLDWNVKV